MSLTGGYSDGAHLTVWNTWTILGHRLGRGGGGGSAASTAWTANNQAFAIPFTVAGPVTVLRLFFQAGTSPGTANYDLGIYNDAFKLIASLGATAAVNTTDAILPSGGGVLTAPTTLPRGRYYLAMSAAATTITVRGLAPTNQIPRMLGVQTMATAHPLPATFVPASMGTTTFIPTLGMMTTDTIL